MLQPSRVRGDELKNRVLEVVAQQMQVPVDAIPLDQHFQDLGLDSVDAMEIMFVLEEELNLSIPDEQAHSVHSINKLLEVLTANLEQE